ncbi:hypothetical protein VTP01DRAFT_5340 [Rhizomucor pusillus]|uniref:uncharacterized protein n=1 Tax=Rhizomucor pusillus TaxID=4840 RepID=UPI0037446B0F
MTHIFEQPMLSLSTQSIHRIQEVDVEDLRAMWSVFTKCKAHLENGERLENMSWRLWYHEKQQHQSLASRTSATTTSDYFSYIPLSPSSSTTSCSSSTSSSIKRFICSLSPGHSAWSHQQKPVEQHKLDNEDACGIAITRSKRSHDDVHRQTWQTPDLSQTNQQTPADPTLSTPDRADDDVDDDEQDDYEDDLLEDEEDDDDDFDLDDYDDDDDDDDDYDDEFDANDCFEKTPPRPVTPRRSLLSAMLQHNATPEEVAQPRASPVLHIINKSAPRENFLRKELSESMCRNILWEHIQQKALYHKTSSSMLKRSLQPLQRCRPPGNAPSDPGWQESFHGW